MRAGGAASETHRTSQILTVPSSLPLTSHLASACHAKLVTLAVCPVRVTSCAQEGREAAVSSSTRLHGDAEPVR